MTIEDEKRIDELILESDLFNFQEFKSFNSPNSFDFSEETILITGAAGSIGNELSKQIINGSYKQVILVDKAESALYELIKYFENTPENVTFVLANITDYEYMEDIFKRYSPSLVFHTAAYKHVPLMEENPYQAIQVNVLGTNNLAQLALKYAVKKFIFISTDKAVNPINIMGMSKRVSENILEQLNHKRETTFFIARFGNIFGSNGSVIPIFKSQIEKERTITLTKNGMSRYFIGKHKAVNLILSLTTMNKTVYTKFTFDMGKPVEVKDVLERLQFYYKKNNIISNFKKTTLQPRSGEKIHEEISSSKEKLHSTLFKDIWAVESLEAKKNNPFDIKVLEKVSPSTPKEDIKSLLQALI